jgi:beta-glucuronidase
MKRLAPLFFLASLALLFLAMASLTIAQPAPLITNIPNRATISLNGRWRTIVDPYDVGEHMRFFLNAKPQDPAALVEYDFETSPLLNVPGDWNSQRDDLLFYEGSLWYEKSFAYHKREHTRTFVYFGAAALRATAYLNGTKLGSHEGGYTPFDFEVTGALREGHNFLVVQVNNRRRPEAIPSLSTDWWNYGGLTRDVLLVELPSAFIQDYFVQSASMTEVAGWIQINGVVQPQNATIDIPEAGVHQSASIDASGYAQFRFPAHLDLWSPSHPKLYRVTLSAAGDSVQDDIGFRRIETRDTKILLNGEPIFLRGVSLHEEAPYRGGRAFSADDDATLLGWAKELGCNFVRLAHYPHNEGMTRLADKMGLLVWSEVPVYWDSAWTNPATLQNAQDQLRENITRDHNRASVILWSIANETPVDPARNEFLNKLAAEARQLDPTRLVTAASNHVEHPDPHTRVINDPLGEFLDVIGVNEYVGWYEGRPEDADQLQWNMVYEKPLIMSEFGAGAPYGNHGAPNVRWTEEYQADVFQRQIRMLQRIPALAGMSPWVLMDFRSPRRLLPGIQDYHNRKGLLSDRGERKQAFYVLQRCYRDQSH